MLEDDLEQCLLSILAAKNILSSVSDVSGYRKASMIDPFPVIDELDKAIKSAKQASSVVAAVKILVKA